MPAFVRFYRNLFSQSKWIYILFYVRYVFNETTSNGMISEVEDGRGNEFRKFFSGKIKKFDVAVRVISYCIVYFYLPDCTEMI